MATWSWLTKMRISLTPQPFIVILLDKFNKYKMSEVTEEQRLTI